MNRFALAALLAVAAAVPARSVADPAPRLPAPPREIAGIPVVLLVDMGSGQRLYAERPAWSFLPASMTKVMTAYVAFELMAQGKLRPGQRFTVSPQTAVASRAPVEWGFAAWQARPLFAAGTPVADARVQGGATRSVPLVADRAVHAAIARGTKVPISLRVAYRGPLVAPIAKGAQVARLKIRVGGLPAGQVPLYAARAVGTAGPLDRLANGLMHLF